MSAANTLWYFYFQGIADACGRLQIDAAFWYGASREARDTAATAPWRAAHSIEYADRARWTADAARELAMMLPPSWQAGNAGADDAGNAKLG